MNVITNYQQSIADYIVREFWSKCWRKSNYVCTFLEFLTAFENNLSGASLVSGAKKFGPARSGWGVGGGDAINILYVW